MELDPLSAFFSQQYSALILLGVIVVIVVALVLVVRMNLLTRSDQEVQKKRLDTLWRELGDARVQPPDGVKVPPTLDNPILTEQFLLEKDACEKIWPLVWTLHEKLGVFLLAVESNEPPGETRLSSRNAALDARSKINELRPFYDEEIDSLLTRLIDTEIKAHLAGCQYLDHKPEDLSGPGDDDGARRAFQQKFRHLHDAEARELLSHLIHVMRRRLVRRHD
ncbi:hypothetical protein [Marinobacter caseinilyticus]|uniref:hypothetical protein n=1 Tax=Marinobacter caseinilyticus TaxID=2692195 RepID=UPI00140AA668|nr:hypothetical protein [Marinobacter caseinilyticus]